MIVTICYYIFITSTKNLQKSCENYKTYMKYIELLSPAKAMSLAFQKADTDILSDVAVFEKTKKQILKLGDRSFNELPTVKRFLEKIEIIDRQ